MCIFDHKHKLCSPRNSFFVLQKCCGKWWCETLCLFKVFAAPLALHVSQCCRSHRDKRSRPLALVWWWAWRSACPPPRPPARSLWLVDLTNSWSRMSARSCLLARLSLAACRSWAANMPKSSGSPRLFGAGLERDLLRKACRSKGCWAGPGHIS